MTYSLKSPPSDAITWTSQRPWSHPGSWCCRDLKLQRPAQQNCALLACDLACWTGVIFSSIFKVSEGKHETSEEHETLATGTSRAPRVSSRLNLLAWKKGKKITPVLQANCNHISLSIICMSIVKKKVVNSWSRWRSPISCFLRGPSHIERRGNEIVFSKMSAFVSLHVYTTWNVKKAEDLICFCVLFCVVAIPGQKYLKFH